MAGGLAAAAAVGLVALVVTRGPGSSDVDTADGGAAETATLEADAGAKPLTPPPASPRPMPPPPTRARKSLPRRPKHRRPKHRPRPPRTRRPAPPPPRASTGAAAGGALPDLGPLANRREARAATEAFTFVDALASPGDGPCAGYPPPVATATFQGTPAYVVIIETAPDGNRLAFLDQATCVVLVKVDPANA